ncbi:MAG: GNAT family N-acetyltransferase [Chloroflexi bacterium]|nr:GNAT family N-acetyltransferase [Chloroflexota bacterium]
MNIRQATPSDAEQIARFNQLMAHETEAKTLDPEIVAHGVAAVLANPTRGFYTVAEIDGEVVGCLMITFEWSDWRNGNIWWIQSVYVEATHRKTGVYRALYEHLYKQAEVADDVAGIRLYVDKTNTAAQTVYRKMGMKLARYDIYEVDFVLGSEGTQK